MNEGAGASVGTRLLPRLAAVRPGSYLVHMDTKTIWKLHSLLMTHMTTGMIRDVAVAFPDGREVAGDVHHISENPGFVLLNRAARRHEDPEVTVDPTRVREVRVTLANGHVERFA